MLPQSNIDLSQGIVFQDQPSLTWIADPVTNRLRGRGDNWEAVRQAVEVIVNVERFKWQIYTPNFGTDYDGLLGTEPGYAASELRRRLEDAFLPDNRILGMKDYAYSFKSPSLTVTFTVLTVFGDVASGMEVKLP
ncbi:MAG: DUF2634 domain-containing protein [Oscillospiraceae bacterium]|nr:DUF2634 domain-containing protein [Oscillospiraceae bacterium]